jgi:hypothetical protein
MCELDGLGKSVIYLRITDPVPASRGGAEMTLEYGPELDALLNPPRKGNFMQVWTGGVYWPLDPRMEEVFIEDIAHALSMQCRYAGHVERFYSVGEHSVHVSHIVPPPLALLGLLHDATEAYLVDVPRPVKQHLTNYKEIEQLNWAVIAECFKVPFDMPPEIHWADAAMLATERAALMKPLPEHTAQAWAMGDVQPPADVTIYGWSPETAKAMFLRRFAELTR